MKIIEDALKRGDKALNEYESKRLLDAYSIPVTKEFVATSIDGSPLVCQTDRLPGGAQGIFPYAHPQDRAQAHRARH